MSKTTHKGLTLKLVYFNLEADVQGLTVTIQNLPGLSFGGPGLSVKVSSAAAVIQMVDESVIRGLNIRVEM